LGKRPTRPGLPIAVLLIRWSTGHDVAEIELAQRAFRADLQIATHNAKDSTDLLEIVEALICSKLWKRGSRLVKPRLCTSAVMAILRD
jgi:hypothetical protein